MDKSGRFVPTMKLSQGKITLPARKQVYRVKDKNGCFVKDIVALHDESVEGTPLLVKVMEKGKIVYRLPKLEEIRENALRNLSKLPDKYKRLERAPRYPVVLSPHLRDLLKELRSELKKIEGST